MCSVPNLTLQSILSLSVLNLNSGIATTKTEQSLVQQIPSENSSSSRALFKYTLIHLPLLMTLMFIGKVTRKDNTTASAAEVAPTLTS